MFTTYHAYHFDVRQPEQKAAYEELKARLYGMGLEPFVTHGSGSHYRPALDGLALELETKHLFANQWNAAPIPGESEKGLRVFDWAEDYQSNIGAPRGVHRGHWLEQTAEMRAVRRNTNRCGYCGHQEAAARGLVFCDRCLDSEYLKASDLKLTRMVCVADDRASFRELSEAEAAHLLPLYKAAQLHGSTERGKARIAKARKDVAEKFAKALVNATVERDGFTWMMDHGLQPGLAIYYSHTGRFCFGWHSNGVDKELEAQLLDIISEFPFPYDMKCADGRVYLS